MQYDKNLSFLIYIRKILAALHYECASLYLIKPRIYRTQKTPKSIKVRVQDKV